MPRYKVVHSPTFVSNHLHGVGDIVEFVGWPGSTLEPLDDVAARIKEYFAAHRRDRKLPRQPDLAAFAEAAPEPEKSQPAHRRDRNPVKDNTDG